MPVLICIDPSSKVSGIAVFFDMRLAYFIRIKPKNKSSSTPLQRCFNMADSVAQWIAAKHVPGDDVQMLIETPGGAASFRGGRGLITLGMAVMGIISKLTHLGFNPDTVDVGHWSRLDRPQLMSKEDRAEKVKRAFPDYAEFNAKDEDAGMDVADAIAMGAWRLKLPGFHRVIVPKVKIPKIRIPKIKRP